MSAKSLSEHASTSSSPSIFVGYEHLIGGFAGGAASTMATHPFDLLKIRFAVHEGRKTTVKVRPAQNSYRHAIAHLYKQTGVRGLFQGLSPNLVAGTISWGVCLQLYDTFKKKYPVKDGMSTDLRNTMGSVTAGCVTLLFTNPLWVSKTQMCLQYSEQKTTLYENMRKTFTTEGIRGGYRGFLAGLVGTTSGGFQIVIYDAMKRHYYQYYHEGHSENYNERKMPNALYIVFSATSKMISTVMTYPYQVVRARLQDQHTRYGGGLHCIRSTFKHEGLLGFYKGMGMSLLKATPATVVTFLVYENVLHALTHQ